jgi:hypothetical protein
MIRTILLVECTTATPHFETTLEILLRSLATKSKVIYLPTYKSIGYSEFGNKDSVARAAAFDNELKEINNPKFEYVTPKKYEMPSLTIPNKFSDLKDFSIHNIRFGRGIIATSASMSGGFPAYEEHEFPDSIIQIAFYMAWQSFVNALAIFESYEINETIIFNGRFATSLPIVELSMLKGIPCYVHERGSSKNSYTLKAYPDTIEKNASNIENFAFRKQEIEIDQYAAGFYMRQRFDLKSLWHESPQFPDLSEKLDLSDDKFDEYVFFHSNLDEFFSLPDHSTDSGLGDQLSAVITLANLLNERDSKLTIRLHPILRFRRLFLDQIVNTLSTVGNCRIIDPSDEANSYELLAKAKAVFHVGSTIGFEAIFNDRISICLGRSVFSHIFPELSPSSADVLAEMLDNMPKVSCDMKRRARLFGAANFQIGIPFFFYQPNDQFSGTFDLSRWHDRL